MWVLILSIFICLKISCFNTSGYSKIEAPHTMAAQFLNL